VELVIVVAIQDLEGKIVLLNLATKDEAPEFDKEEWQVDLPHVVSISEQVVKPYC